MPAIPPVSAATAIPDTIRLAGESPAGTGFQDALVAAMDGVENLGRTSSASVERFLAGEGEELHSTVLAAERADLGFQLFLQARNKVVSAYQEIMRMQM